MLRQLAHRLPTRCVTARVNITCSSRQTSSLTGHSSATPAALSGQRAVQHTQQRQQPASGDGESSTPSAPPQRYNASQLTSMSIIPIGYDEGRFELEVVRGAPQLWHDVPEESRRAALDAPSASAAVFDLSYVPAPAQEPSALRSSWATDRSATSSMEGKLRQAQQEAQQQETLRQHNEWKQQQGTERVTEEQQQQAPASAQFARSKELFAQQQQQQLQQEAAPAFTEQPSLYGRTGGTDNMIVPADDASSALSNKRASAPASNRLPLDMHLIVEGSLIIYQNFMFSWSPKVHTDITAASLAFLRVLTPRPELVLIGTGANASVRLSRDTQALLDELRIGVEVMDTGNAIATYNILSDEGRTVLTALIQKAPERVVERKLTRSEQMRQRLGYWQPELEGRQY